MAMKPASIPNARFQMLWFGKDRHMLVMGHAIGATSTYALVRFFMNLEGIQKLRSSLLHQLTPHPSETPPEAVWLDMQLFAQESTGPLGTIQMEPRLARSMLKMVDEYFQKLKDGTLPRHETDPGEDAPFSLS